MASPSTCFPWGHLILFTVTQRFLEPRKATYYDKISKRPQALTEIERRKDSFTAASDLIGEDHPLAQLAMGCLQEDPDDRPTAPEIMQQMEQMPTIPYRSWGQSKSELIQNTIEQENIVNVLQHEISQLTQQLSESQHSNEQLQREKEQLIKHQSEYSSKLKGSNRMPQQHNAPLRSTSSYPKYPTYYSSRAAPFKHSVSSWLYRSCFRVQGSNPWLYQSWKCPPAAISIQLSSYF